MADEPAAAAARAAHDYPTSFDVVLCGTRLPESILATSWSSFDGEGATGGALLVTMAVEAFSHERGMVSSEKRGGCWRRTRRRGGAAAAAPGFSFWVTFVPGFQ
ncbi:hypothetical protein SETIT_6G128100v2 [Setaria italica]|uniref:Uncharacterized protein n=1 Tax=Setaria italica TaxID=4555 RepID=A0A368RL09_SETIT|nr:hypothetical protein SETIT_6G128100v2 [Setaria italica]